MTQAEKLIDISNKAFSLSEKLNDVDSRSKIYNKVQEFIEELNKFQDDCHIAYSSIYAHESGMLVPNQLCLAKLIDKKVIDFYKKYEKSIPIIDKYQWCVVYEMNKFYFCNQDTPTYWNNLCFGFCIGWEHDPYYHIHNSKKFDIIEEGPVLASYKEAKDYAYKLNYSLYFDEPVL